MNLEKAIKTLKAYKKAFVFQTDITENDYSDYSKCIKKFRIRSKYI